MFSNIFRSIAGEGAGAPPLRGAWGAARRAVFEAWYAFLLPDLSFEVRSRRPLRLSLGLLRYPQLDKADKRDILGLNSANLYRLTPRSGTHTRTARCRPTSSSAAPNDLKVLLEFPPNPPGQTAEKDNLSEFQERTWPWEWRPSPTR